MTFLIRRDTAANWTAKNSLLADGQLGYETNTGRIKIGNGVTAWTALDYRFETSAAAWGSIAGTLSAQTDLNAALNGKQANLVSGTNIKTVGGISILGAGDIPVSGGGGSVAWGDITGTLSAQTDLQSELDGKQPLATVLTNTTASFTTAQETKLSGIATGATANAADAFLLSRDNHTGTQAAATITGLAPVATSGSAADLSAGTLPAARFDDTAHGVRAGGTLHANAVAAGAAGFMTGADKTKLDGVGG
ncbi:MAG: hypothetical protein U5N55_04890 [Cypionkella sp.]|nr:hypothetical protein [Cypionkella sp.]